MADFCSISESVSFISQLFAEGEVNIVEYLTLLSQPEENYCFSIITQVIIRTTAFSFILFVSSSETSRNREEAILKLSASLYSHLASARISIIT